MLVTFAAVVAAAAGLPALGFATYLAALSLLSLPRGRSRPDRNPACLPYLTVLVPAHDEELCIARCVASLRATDYPLERRRLVVVADNCSDRTAVAASRAGAEVMVRVDRARAGKGHALAWAIAKLRGQGPDSRGDAVVVVDADTVVDRGFLRELAAALASGDAVQARYKVLDPQPEGSQVLRAAAIELFNHVRAMGRERLGDSVPLLGNGMLLSRRVLDEHPWDAFEAVEDLGYWLSLARAGVRVRYCPDAVVRAPLAPTVAGELTQRLRWEGGRLSLVIGQWSVLLRDGVLHRRRLLSCLLELSTPPLTVLASASTAGSALTVGLVAWARFPALAATSWIVAATCLAVYVLAGFWAAGVGWQGYLALLRTPAFGLRKAQAYARLLTGFDRSRWTRTERSAG